MRTNLHLLSLLQEVAHSSFSSLLLFLILIIPLIASSISSLLSRLSQLLASPISPSPASRFSSSFSSSFKDRSVQHTQAYDSHDYYRTPEETHSQYGDNPQQNDPYNQTQNAEPLHDGSRFTKLSLEDRLGAASGSVQDHQYMASHTPSPNELAPMYPSESLLANGERRGDLSSPRATKLPPTFSMVESRLRELSNQVQSEGTFRDAIAENVNEAEETSESDAFMEQFQQHFGLDR